MNIISCNNCGTLFDYTKISFPPDSEVYQDDFSFNEDKVIWNGSDFVPVAICPVCKTKGLYKHED